MKKSEFKWQILSIILILVVIISSNCSKTSQKVYHVGILCGAQSFSNIADGFKAKLTELGYIEGKNITYDLHKLNVNPAEEYRILKKFVENKVDMIFAFPTDQAMRAKSVCQKTNIPVVFAMAGIESGNLIKSVREPGYNITGVRFPNAETTTKRFEMLLELVPHAKRIFYMYEVIHPNTKPARESLKSIAESSKLTLIEVPVNTIEEMRTVLIKRVASKDIGIDAIFLMPDILNNSPEGFDVIIQFANKYNIPVAGGMHYTSEHGAMFSFVPDNFEQGKLAAVSADKIFKGISAGTIPVVTPEVYLHINYKIIKKLGLKAPEKLLFRASKIIR